MKENNIAKTAEARAKISVKMMNNNHGSFVRTEETRRKTSKSLTGKRHTKETIEKIRKKRALQVMQVMSPESIEKRALSNKGKKRNLVSCLYCYNTIPVNVFGKRFHKEGICKNAQKN